MKKPHLRYRNQNPRERHWTIHLLAGVKLLKGILLFLVAIKLLTLIDRDAGEWFADFIARHRIDPDKRLVHGVIEKLAGVDRGELIAFSVGSFLYSALQLTEGIGLWLEKLGRIPDGDRDRASDSGRDLRDLREIHAAAGRGARREPVRSLVSGDAAQGRKGGDDQ